MKISPAFQKSSDLIEGLSLAQRERLAFIDFNLQFFGKVSRSDLISRFKTGLAASTRDFAAYREIAQNNLALDHSTKQYLRKHNFEPLFQFSADAILQSVSKGFSDGITATEQPSEHCFDAIQLIHPNVHIIAALMRGIHNKVKCTVKYVSISSGESQRIIVPHAIINNGHRWHVRAFDEKSASFRDFVCTRFTQVSAGEEKAERNQLSIADEQFNRLVSLVLMVHPDIKHRQAIEMDFDMQNGEKIMQVRAALAAYVLRQWQVDCSFEHRILNQGCQLALKNHEVLASIENPQLAPGVKKS
ncbi:WYL domain-containing protein [Glaciecola sp. 2405UD65-10]|uniref:WYL domain-containing protein n=1 Tax=Glaciecola sp. 2405UD65-10 TaxID=3397244 RepID=UPI003B59B2D8